MQFVFPSLFDGSVLDVVPINIICSGSRSHATLKDTTVVNLFLSSKLNICTFLITIKDNMDSNLIIVHNKSW
jgi:hypothetical protein